MGKYAYIARTRDGEKVEGNVNAGDKRAALMQLERMGYVPVSVREAAAPAAKKKPARGSRAAGGARRKSLAKTAPSASTSAPRGGLFGSRAPRMNIRDVLLLTRELSDLLASGMTLGSALHTLCARESGKTQDLIMTSLRDDIVQGASLSEALSRHPTTFGNLYVSMVKAGEASGTLPDVLERLASHYERVQDAREKVMMALVYPCIILLVGAGTMIFSMVFVIPRFTAIFDELGSTLPASTQLLKGLSEALMTYWWVMLLLIMGLVFLFRRALGTHAGRRWWDGLQLRIPVVRGIVCANSFAHFARTLGALLNNGVPVVNALTIVENTVGNTIITDQIREARERVVDGATLSVPLAQGKVFPQLLTDMLAVGEQSGDMSGALGHIANRYDRELDRTVKIFTTLLEPIMILFMAGLVGFIAVSMLSAVFDMTSGLNP
jgi:type II secretory pathway component PulF